MNKNVLIGVLGFGGAAITAGCGYLARKVKKLTDKVGKTMDEITDSEVKEIREDMVEEAVRKAAERSVKRYAKDAADDALKEIREEVRKSVKRAVDEAYADISQSVTDEVATQVANIDQSALRREVTEKAKKRILEKFDGDLDHILDDARSALNDNLRRIKKVYDDVSEAIAPKRDKDDNTIRFKLG